MKVFSSLKNHGKLLSYKNGVSIYHAKSIFELYSPFEDPYLDLVNVIISAIELDIDIIETKLPVSRDTLLLYIIDELSKTGKFNLIEDKSELYEDIKKEIVILKNEHKKKKRKLITFNQIYDHLFKKFSNLEKNDLFTVIYHYFDFHVDYKKDVSFSLFKDIIIKL